MTSTAPSASMPFRVDLDFIGLGGAAKAYGGHLKAWSFEDLEPQEWFSAFRQQALEAISQRFLPVYRMADGEYRFLMGRRYNFHRRPILKELLAVTAEKVRLRDPDKWTTSWGESYPPGETKHLRSSLIGHIRFLSRNGYLACYINDNGLNAFTEYNRALLNFFQVSAIPFGPGNYVPFHFAPSLLVSPGWEAFIKGRHLLVITGATPQKSENIVCTLMRLGARKASFLAISGSSALSDQLDLREVEPGVDICLVAAGIGSANILRQLAPLNTLAIDIGGLMNCFADNSLTQHGGVFGVPKVPAAIVRR